MRKNVAKSNITQFLIAAMIGVSPNVGIASELERPNIVLIIADNLGYGDIGCYGSKLNRTPHIDRMAAEGMRFTDYYSAAPVCTPARASIMTGCYPRRVNMHVEPGGRSVLFTGSSKGLNPDEITVAEVLKARGYATAAFGKWHLGDQLPFLPTRQGFDYYLGVPCADNLVPLVLMENERVIEQPTDRNLLTKRYTEKVVEFIKEQKDRPFFVYMAHTAPGSDRPVVSDRFRGRSANGLYGDVVEELDWSAGQIVETLYRLKIHKRTLVIWCSDNGSIRRFKGSSKAPLSGRDYSTQEGGMRVPCVMWWPGRIPAGGECRELITSMDFFPTFGSIAGGKIPDDRIIDGHDIRPLVFGEADAQSPYGVFYYYFIEQLQAVRCGKWKLHLPLKEKVWTPGGSRRQINSPAILYDLEKDIGETTNLADEHPDVVKRLMELAERAREDIGDLDRPGKNCRPAGLFKNPTPPVLEE